MQMVHHILHIGEQLERVENNMWFNSSLDVAVSAMICDTFVVQKGEESRNIMIRYLRLILKFC